ncbi:MAG: ABC transporter substrate-binding protein [Actinobacteria bacterium]|nr:ABC transporter substrate-binding protein [Actinomycetota bacterium]
MSHSSRSSRLVRLIALAAAGALALAACNGGDSGGGGGGTAKGTCPVDALDKAGEPVEITLWHSMNRANEEVLAKLVDEYQAQQPKVKVQLINQTSYQDTFEKFKAGLSSGDLPDLVQIEDTGTQQMIDTQAITPVQACIDADGYKTSDYLTRVLDYYTVEDTLWPMPFNVSNPVLYYDENAFTAAGLDPEDPPKTLDEVTTYAERIKAAGYEYGYGLKLDPWWIEQESAKGGVTFVNNGNGRDARATKATFDNEVGQQVFAWMDAMVDDGLAVTNSADGPSAVNNLLAIRSKKVGMTVDTSAALGTISQVLSSGEGGGVKLGVGPMPGPTGKGGVLVGGAALYISAKSSAAKQAAAWDLAKFLTSSQSQAIWAAGTGYVPIRESAAESQVIEELWVREPGYKVAYDQLVTGVENVATAGPVIGPYQAIRDVVLAAEQRMFTQGTSSDDALTDAQRAANEALAEYNERIGA